MRTPRSLDDNDRQILDLLHENARRSVADMAERTGLSAAAVTRRITRLEATGVILGYTVEVDFRKLGWGLEAFAELRFTGTTSPDEMSRAAVEMPEVQGIFTTAGTQDTLVWLRATDVEHLTQLIAQLRRAGNVVSTRTIVVLASRLKRNWRPRRS
jgi:DNA-binding Lrp family transcriptional regulator